MKNILGKQIPEGAVGIWRLGQGGFVFKTSENKVIVVDPYLSDSVEKNGGLKRMVKIPIKPEEVVTDFVLLTHDHLDHTDPETITKIAQVRRFIGPASVCRHLRKLGIVEGKITEINRGQERIIDGIKITAAFTKHTKDSVGYFVGVDSIVIYITGDTEYDEKLKEAGKYKPDIMLICINGKWGNMSAEDAALLTREIYPKLVIPMHYGMFKENTADPNDFLTALDKYKVNCKKKVLDFNSCFIYEV